MADSEGVQYVIDGLGAVVMAAVGLIVRNSREDHKELEAKHDRLAEEIPRTFARRDDVKDGFDRLEGKLDRLLDRRYGSGNHDANGDR